MALNLSDNLIAEKNKLNTSSCWLWLLEILLADATTFRFVRNTEDIIFDGNKYTAIGFDLDLIKGDAQGTIPSVVLKISNVGRILQKYIELLEGASIKLARINSALLSENYEQLEYEFVLMKTEYDANWRYFTLGNFNPYNRPFPLGRFKVAYCDYPYEGAECGYSGALPTCDHTLDGDDGCVVHENSSRFGAFLGMKEGGLKVGY